MKYTVSLFSTLSICIVVTIQIITNRKQTMLARNLTKSPKAVSLNFNPFSPESNVEIDGIRPIHMPATMLKNHILQLLAKGDQQVLTLLNPLMLMSCKHYDAARKILYGSSIQKNLEEELYRNPVSAKLARMINLMAHKGNTIDFYRKIIPVVKKLPIEDEIKRSYVGIDKSPNIQKLLKKVTLERLHHIAIIPDGDRRWARARGLHESEGHKRAFTELSPLLIEDLLNIGVNTITLWGTSPYTLKRSQEELANLMIYFAIFVQRILPIAHQHQIRIVRLGSKNHIPKYLLKILDLAEKNTRKYSKHVLNFAINYGGNDEIIRACNKMISSKNSKPIVEINESYLAQFLDTAGQQYPNPDLIIRASGAQRISGFMAFQIPFSEWHFETTFFPDFNGKTIQSAILQFSQRKRRFGK